jgi:hypothetical protein
VWVRYKNFAFHRNEYNSRLIRVHVYEEKELVLIGKRKSYQLHRIHWKSLQPILRWIVYEHGRYR